MYLCMYFSVFVCTCVRDFLVQGRPPPEEPVTAMPVPHRPPTSSGQRPASAGGRHPSSALPAVLPSGSVAGVYLPLPISTPVNGLTLQERCILPESLLPVIFQVYWRQLHVKVRVVMVNCRTHRTSVCHTLPPLDPSMLALVLMSQYHRPGCIVHTLLQLLVLTKFCCYDAAVASACAKRTGATHNYDTQAL